MSITERCKCDAGCDDYDHRDPHACGGVVYVVDADSICPRHACEKHMPAVRAAMAKRRKAKA